jgi:hypothetical protein
MDLVVEVFLFGVHLARRTCRHSHLTQHKISDSESSRRSLPLGRLFGAQSLLEQHRLVRFLAVHPICRRHTFSVRDSLR